MAPVTLDPLPSFACTDRPVVGAKAVHVGLECPRNAGKGNPLVTVLAGQGGLAARSML